MKKNSWQIGQNIYPEHFQALEQEAFFTSLNIFKNLYLNITGFVDFQLDKDLLNNNILKFQKLSFITHDNRYVDIFKNAIINKLDINELSNTYNNNMNFFIGINFLENEIYEEYYEKYNDYIKYEKYNLNLVVSNIKNFDVLIGEVHNEIINFNSNFPFNKLTKDENSLLTYLEIEKLVYTIKKELKEILNQDEISDKLLYESLCSELLIFEYYFNQSPHPKIIFDKLFEIYVKLSQALKLSSTANNLIIRYNHNNQRLCFDNILKEIYKIIKDSSSKFEKEYFEYSNGKFYIEDFDVTKLLDKKVYIKSSQNKASYLLKNIKISSISRLDYINIHALEGVKVINSKKGIVLDFGLNTEELKYIHQDKNIGFVFDANKEEQIYLYYQK